MSARRFFLALAAIVGAGFLPMPVGAQYGAPYGFEPVQRFRCESHDGRTSQCRVNTRGGVALVRQLSRGACIEGRTWGWDRRGVWVTGGCRAEFEVGGGYGDGGVVRCESHDGRQNYCAMETRGGVVLLRQLSRGACIEGRTWGFDRRGVWVADGCRGEFSSARGGGWNDGGWHGGDDWSGGPGPGYGGGGLVRCESRNGRTQYCDIGNARDVRLERQLSRGECSEGYTWGVDRRGLWVSRGCRGEFSVW
jgi:hypothetical protein